MIFHIRLRLGRGADAKSHGAKTVLLIKSAAVGIHLKCVQPYVFWRESLGVVQQRLANPAPLKIGMHEKLIHEIARNGKETRHAPVHFSHPHIVILQNHVSKIFAIFREGVTLRALKIWERQFPRRAPQARHRIKIIECVGADDHFGIVL